MSAGVELKMFGQDRSVDYGAVACNDAGVPHMVHLSRTKPQTRSRTSRWLAVCACALGVLSVSSRRTNAPEVLSASALAEPFAWTSHPLVPKEAWGELSAPYPTGAWWTNAVRQARDSLLAIHTAYIRTKFSR